MKNIYSSSALAVLAVLFIVLTMLSSIVFKGWRLDLTENSLYTLSEGTVNIAESLDQKIRLRLYFSDTASEDLPQIRSYAERVWELMQELAAQSDGMIELERIDPEPFSEAEDDAARYGLEAVPLNQAGDVLYFGVVGTNAVDGLEVLPFLSPNREALLEYDLARMVSTLSSPDLPRVGLISGLQLSGGFDMRSGQRTPSWAVFDQWSELFDLTTIETTGESGAVELPSDLDALVVVHPKNLSEDMMFAVDQFVLGGGRLLAFVDPYAEADPGENPNDPASRFMAERSSTLGPLFEAWGIEMDTEQFVADLGRALQVTIQQGQPPVRHPAILGLSGSDLSERDIVTGDLNTVNVASAGALEDLDEDAGPAFEFLMQSSESSGLLATERLRMAADPSALIEEIGLDDRRYTLAARLTGEAETAFPDRVGNGPDGTGRSSGTINAIVVADTDLLADNMWVQRQSFLGSVILNPFADNGALAVNALENLLGNAELISIRSRSTSTRTFEMVEDLRRQAEARLRETEQRLEAELREAENRLTQLQQGRGDSDMSILTPEQEAEIDRFMEQRLEIRQQLRQVRRELDEEIEALGTRIKIINVVLVPLLVTIVALFVAWRRRRQQHGANRS